MLSRNDFLYIKIIFTEDLICRNLKCKHSLIISIFLFLQCNGPIVFFVFEEKKDGGAGVQTHSATNAGRTLKCFCKTGVSLVFHLQ